MQVSEIIIRLRQANRQWFAKLSTAVISYGYTESKFDHSLFVKGYPTTSFTALSVYFDDVISADNNLHEIDRVKEMLDSTFKIKDLGDLKFFVGFEIASSSKGIPLCQRKYIYFGIIKRRYANLPPHQCLTGSREMVLLWLILPLIRD